MSLFTFNRKAWLGARLQIGLSSREVAVVMRQGRKSSVLAHQAWDGGTAPDAKSLLERCGVLLAEADCKGLPAQVIVADSWARLFMVAPPANAARLQDLQAAALMRFQALYGEAASDWQLQADWQTGRPFLVCAMPKAMLAALEQMAATLKLRLASIQPHFVSAWNRHHRALFDGAWFGAVQGDSLMLGAVTGGRRLQALRRIAIAEDGHGLAWLQEQVTRAALQLGFPAPLQLQLAGNHAGLWRTSAAAKGTLIVGNLDQVAAAGDSAIPTIAPAVMLAQAGLPS